MASNVAIQPRIVMVGGLCYFRFMLIPLKDINPTQRRPYVTYTLVAGNVLAYLYQYFTGLQLSVLRWGLVPRTLFGGEAPEVFLDGIGVIQYGLDPFATMLTSMFMHGGLLHLGGNMLYLWIFGNNVEDRLGHLRFFVFYLLGGLLAGLAHALLNMDSPLPMVGASGAVAAVLGAYFRLYPRARVRCLIFIVFFITFVELPASVVLGFWILLQILNGFIGMGAGSGGVAWFAHIGGFIAGMILLRLLRPTIRWNSAR